MGWVFVILAAVAEIVGVIGLRFYSQHKTVRNLLLYIGGFGLSFALLYASFNYLQLSIAYVVWVGIGTVGAVLVNIMFFGESKNLARIISIVAIIIGVAGLKAVS
ncbi:multidrug efflux SMR transporter [Lysinibacillus sp. fkY74-1]|uniref:Quaternary ammonium compound-resistance protein, small multidrug resistance protein family n=3 Tax=Lysinibacillus TaxID=400634 RepID=B1HT41_LYSSC|nr:MULTISPECIES: SMR family transporter [Lysinibacillus]MBE5086292.1 QacE family quaternary ammonium compound efflux SMR transporter [Bacillus thuringiensis]UZN00840.1 SMR family transporter [Lysinibacillus sp. MHQ-1]ACA37795.1 quaternary ammonium compound-resistance protein, small multidrug resistance protein family [Lysinibacillus sphaericus C3-41]AMO32000.1 multidrug resistance protein SMR [Lysinibacillus sphaericus]AMR88881.1 multidrug resistance protein SMR [Lysinibacillus sphaericus]